MADGTTAICDASTRNYCTEVSGHGSSYSWRDSYWLQWWKLQTHWNVELGSGERIQNHGQRGSVDVAKQKVGNMQQRATVERLAEYLLANIIARLARLWLATRCEK